MQRSCNRHGLLSTRNQQWRALLRALRSAKPVVFLSLAAGLWVFYSSTYHQAGMASRAPAASGFRRDDTTGRKGEPILLSRGSEAQEEKQPRDQAPESPAPLPAPQVPRRDGGCSAQLEHTDLPGDAVKWGSDHLQPSAAACCATCSTEPRCNEWVWCGDSAACGQQHLQCWLKRREDPWLDVDLLLGMSDGWTSGITWRRPGAPPPLGGADGSDWDLALVMQHGPVRIKLRDKETPLAAKFVESVLRAAAEAGVSSGAAPGVDELHPVREGTRFYRAEPVPSHWGSRAWPDTWQGGRWGPPYSLLQGSLVPKGVRVPPSPAAGDQGQGARPVIRRGMVAWAGGGGGPDFFIALANHPEWGNGHAVWGQVLPEDMALVDGGTSWNAQPGAAGWSVMTRPLRVANWGSINATELVTPVPFNVARNPLRPSRRLQ